MQDYTDHIGFNARVRISRTGRRNPPVELHYTVDSTLRGPQAEHHIDPQAIEVALTILRLSEFHTGRHMEQITDWRPAVLRTVEPWHIRLCQIVDRFDRTLSESDANQHRCDRLRHRL